MQLERKVLAFGRLPSSKGDLYVPAGVKGYVQNAVLHNTGGSAETVLLNYHDGTSEHQWLQQSIGAGDTLTLNLPGEGDTIDAGGRLTGSADTADTVTYKLSGVESGWPAHVASNLWVPPMNPHPMDDEFDGHNLDSWAVRNLAGFDGSFSFNDIDSYDSGFISGNVIRAELNRGRPSWLITQPPASGNLFFIFKSYTLPTNLLMWARMRFNMQTPAVNNDDCIALAFMTDGGSGYPVLASRVTLYLNETDTNIVQAQAQYTTTGGVDTGFTMTTDVDFQGQALEYAAIHKIGGTYHMWVGTNAGNWIWMTSFSGVGFTPDMVGFYVYNNTAPAGVHGFDFIRFIETDNFLL